MKGLREKRIYRGFLQAGKVLLVIFLLLSALPYVIPLPEDREVEEPFAESARISIEGVSLHYRIWEPEEIRGKIILVHGLGGSTFSWRHNIEALVNTGYVVTAVDLPGFGYSSRQKGADHSQKARSRVLWHLMDEIDGSLKAGAASMGWNLVGHSMGGGTITAMALQKPPRVNSLVFVAGAVHGRPPGAISRVLSYPPLVRWLKVAYPYILTPERVQGLLASAYGEEPSAGDVRGYLEPLALPGTVDTLADLLRTPRGFTDDLENIKVPALLVWGENDAWVPLEFGEMLADNLPDAELLVMPDTGHCPMETRPEEFNQALLDFLAALK